jgi:hypothetical protein
MKKRSQIAFLLTRSGNPKSTIQNHKSVGIFAFVVTLAIGGAVASAQQPG